MDYCKLAELEVLLHADREHLIKALDIGQVEIPQNSFDENGLTCDIVKKILSARFHELFEIDEVRSILNVPQEGKWHVALAESVQCYLNKSISPDDKQRRQAIVLFIGVAALQLFVQQNWTGPIIKQCFSDIFPFLSESESCTQWLTFCNQQVYPLIKNPEFLLLAKVILHDIDNVTETSALWKVRYFSIHHAILEDKNSAVYLKIMNAVQEAMESPACVFKAVATQLKIEAALLSLRFHDISKSKKYLKEIQEDLGLCVKLSGALGTKTHFQTVPYAQLFLQVEKEKSSNDSLYSSCTVLPIDVKLQDDTLRNDIKFVEPDEHISGKPVLNVEDISVILVLSVLHQKQNAHDELLEEELNAYANFILSNSSNFCIQFCALMLRSHLEKQRSKRVERAMLQLQALLDQSSKSTESMGDRLQLFYCTPMPPIWAVEKDLAKLLLSLGSVKSALEIFLRLEMWEECVFCYKSLQRNDKALQIIDTQLQKGKTPLLLCLKGDVTNEPSWYEEAWELSDHHSARAKRSLGYYHFQKKEYKECIPHLLESVEIDSLEQRAWFFLGHAATQIENYELAAKCYRHLINLNPESFEAWNNLSNAYIRLNDKLRAWRTLQEAIKCNYEEWKVWENYLLVSIDVGAFEEAINAFHRLVELKGKHIDDQVLNILEKAVLQNLNDINDQPASRLLEKLLKLIGHITSSDPSSFKTWTSYANLLEYKASKHEDPILLDRVIQYHHKSLNIIKNDMQKNLSEKSLTNYKALLDSAFALSEVYIKRYIPNSGEAQAKQQLHSAKLTIRNTLTFAKQIAEHFSDSEIQNEVIQPRLQELEGNLDAILNVLV